MTQTEIDNLTYQEILNLGYNKVEKISNELGFGSVTDFLLSQMYKKRLLDTKKTGDRNKYKKQNLEGYEKLNQHQKDVIDRNNRKEMLQIARSFNLSFCKSKNLQQAMIDLFNS